MANCFFILVHVNISCKGSLRVVMAQEFCFAFLFINENEMEVGICVNWPCTDIAV